MKTFLFIASIILSCKITQAQHEPFQLYIKNDKLYFLHEVKAGNTLYGISKTYQIDPNLILDMHTLSAKNALSIGDSLLIHFDRSRYRTDIAENTTKTLIYQVKPGDTFFKLARIMLGIKEHKLLEINHKESTDLKIGELILLGYYANWTVNQIEPENLSEDNNKIKWDDNIANKEDVNKTWVTDQGLAIWYEDEQFGDEKFVMHPDAITGSYILLYNPMNKRKVKAKVIGNIPQNTYPKEVKMLLSPGVAKYLGALDTRFYVKFKYEKAEFNH